MNNYLGVCYTNASQYNGISYSDPKKKLTGDGIADSSPSHVISSLAKLEIKFLSD